MASVKDRRIQGLEMKKVYLDNAATTPILPQVLEAMLPFYSGICGNPSSIHRMGREARQAVEGSRGKIARLLGSHDSEIVFTSGGTEADNLAIKGVAYAMRKKGKHIITTTIEHHAVLNTCKCLESEGFEVTYLSVDPTGLVEPKSVEESIRRDTILISVMHANNEVGTIEPIRQIGQMTRERGISFHTDAVQTFGHIPTLVDELGVDLLSTSAHKLYGPKGVGALYIRHGTRIKPIIHGGRQEDGLRASTENVPGIVGFGKAAQIALDEMEEREKRVLRLRDRLSKRILDTIDYSRLNGHPKLRLPGNVNVALRYVEGESLVLGLDQEGICVSTGSACSSPELGASHVLQAMGLTHEDLHGSVRFSLGIQNTLEEIDFAIGVLNRVTEKLRRMSPLYGGVNNLRKPEVERSGEL